MSQGPPPPPPPPPGPPPPPPPGYNPYPSGGPDYPYRPVQDQGQATTALVLGILGLAVCQIIAPIALVIGRNSMKEIDASGGQLGGRGKALAGFIMGIIGTVILVVGVLLLALVFAVGSTSSSGIGNIH
ncbi:MAG: hypothetical protein QOI51_402 [Nocardioidaceae bacterium]|nr:hypothetical protein [Nocardioidaceae bacterium]MDX6307556.1 hypothetical protein [Nocardioidaceae bacterium]